MPAEIPAAFQKLLSDNRAFAHLATVKKDGSPQVTPVWFDYTDGKIRVNTAKGRVKARTMQQGARVALSIVDPDNAYRYLQLRGEIENVVPDPTGAFYSTLQQRYRGHTSEVKDKDVRVVFTVRPTAFKVRG
jgi:PPOX class probable F420-dependent enzyme